MAEDIDRITNDSNHSIVLVAGYNKDLSFLIKRQVKQKNSCLPALQRATLC